MTNAVKEDHDLRSLADAAQKRLGEKGYEVGIDMNEQETAFDLVLIEDGEERRLCRVQSVHANTWEVVRANGDTLTGLGDEDTFLTMIERLVEPPKGRFGRH